MSPLRNSIAAISLALACVVPAAAQVQPARPHAEQPPVTASATSERVRFAAPNRVARLRLEVLSASGDLLFEAASRGSVLDWTLSDSQGGRLADGTYLCVLTVKDASGRMSQRLTLLEVAGDVVSARAAAPADLTPRQSEAVGPVEAEAAAVVAPSEVGVDAPAAALLAHDGEAGQLVTTRGDLSFRGGDFFTGRDKELMRLSSDGSLEVTGSLLARGGIRFSDGTTLTSAAGLGRAGAGGKGGKAAADGSPDPGVSPSAITNRLPKYNSSGVLIDSAFSDFNGTLGVGTDAPDTIYKLDVRGHVVLGNTRKISLVADFPGNGEIAPGGFFGALGNNGLSFAASTDAGLPGAQVKLVYYNGSQWLSALEYANVAGGGRTNLALVKNGGNVGIGTSTPQARLDVAGNLRVTGDAVIDGNIAAKYQDVAEWVPGRGELPAGTVVVLDRARTNGVVASRRAYSTHVAGVVSAQPGVILGEGGPGRVMVATTGRVKVKVDATRAPIRVGDLLVASDTEGVAMRSVPVRAGRARLHRPGTIIGKALEPLAKGRGEILVLLSMQ